MCCIATLVDVLQAAGPFSLKEVAEWCCYVASSGLVWLVTTYQTHQNMDTSTVALVKETMTFPSCFSPITIYVHYEF